MSRSYISSPPRAFMACSGTDLAFSIVTNFEEYNHGETIWKYGRYNTS
jgi:hypothetical protein